MNRRRAPLGGAPAKEERPGAGTSHGLATFVGAALVVTWLRPANLPALALLALVALGLAWVFRAVLSAERGRRDFDTSGLRSLRILERRLPVV